MSNPMTEESDKKKLHTLFATRCDTLATAADEETLFASAETYGHFVPHALEENATRSRLLGAAITSGMPVVEAQEAISKGLASGMADPRPIPRSVANDEEVEFQVQKRLVRHEADKRFSEILASANPLPPVEQGVASDLFRDLGPEMEPRVESLLPAEGRLLLAAQRKTGKTTFLVNLARSLITGEPFLGKLHTRPVVGRIGFLNYEVSGRTLLKWLDEAHVPLDRVFLVNLRGRRNPLNTENGRREISDMLQKAEVEVLMVDPFGRAYGGKSQNDAAEVTPWLVMLDEVAANAGCSELILTTHAGWNGDRTRGSSALEDWPDTVAWMTRNERDERFLKAEGRMDDELPEQLLEWDHLFRTLTLSGGSRKLIDQQRKIDMLTGPVCQAVKNNPGANVRKVEDILREDRVKFRSGDVGKTLSMCVGLGLLRVETGERGAKMHYLEENQKSPSGGEG